MAENTKVTSKFFSVNWIKYVPLLTEYMQVTLLHAVSDSHAE